MVMCSLSILHSTEAEREVICSEIHRVSLPHVQSDICLSLKRDVFIAVFSLTLLLEEGLFNKFLMVGCAL